MFNEYLTANLKEHGATQVGFADLSVIPQTARQNLPYGIAIAIALDPTIVSRIPTGPHLDYYDGYKLVNNQLNTLCEYTAQLIVYAGYKAFPQSRRNVRQDENRRTPLPHKTVATLAGMGWIGKSAVLVTEEYGSAVRLTTILTDMPFVTGTPVVTSKCGDCMECTVHCPGKAVKGAAWNAGIAREELLDPDACKETVINRGREFDLTEGTCGVCLAICPYTKRYIKNAMEKTNG